MDKRKFPRGKSDPFDRMMEVSEESDFGAKNLPGINKPSPISGVSAFVFSLIKFVFGLLLLAFVYSSTVAFLGEFQTADLIWRKFFWSGVIAFVLMYFFVIELSLIYQRGHRMLEIVFSFFSPLVKVAPYVVPIYAIIIVVIYSVYSLFAGAERMLHILVFLFGFSLSLHLVYSAKTLRSKKGDFLKANYIFGFSFVYIINIFIAAFCVNIIFARFSFVNFCNNSYQRATGIYSAVFKQVFVPK
ncbi:MAG: hypothetical protein ABIG46_07980 [Candidatus Omnitrophota bacterium]|nr:hypothetical protein [Candidatus Omnitrophota bacterium]